VDPLPFLVLLGVSRREWLVYMLSSTLSFS
jgi:hypothetical protein